MPNSLLKKVGLTLVLVATLTFITIQTTGHGMTRRIYHPATPPNIAVRGVTLDRRVTITEPLGFKLVEWMAVIGLICICIPRNENQVSQ